MKIAMVRAKTILMATMMVVIKNMLIIMMLITQVVLSHIVHSDNDGDDTVGYPDNKTVMIMLAIQITKW